MTSVPDSLLLVVGGGPLLVHYQRRSKSLGLERQVVFTGEVSHSEVPSYVGLSEVALLFFSERLVNAYRCSLKLREYFAAGIPVVCNDFGELKQYAHFTYIPKNHFSRNHGTIHTASKTMWRFIFEEPSRLSVKMMGISAKRKPFLHA